jgi:hypothetical protein
VKQETRRKQATFVKLDPAQREVLDGLAKAEGSTMSALLRRAAIAVFHLPIDGTETAAAGANHAAEDNAASTPAVTGGAR